MCINRVLRTAAILSLVVFGGTAGYAETKASADKGSFTECTVQDVFTKKAALAGKDIAVKGKVVKFSGGIMGTNWFHIKDGTGSTGTDDLVVTSKDVAKVGDQVVARGKLSTEVDFGSGYKYAVIIQDAKVSAK